MPAPTRGTRLLLALGGMLAFAGVPIGLTGSAAAGQQADRATGAAAAAYTDAAFAWLVGGGVTSAVGALLAGVALFRMWRSGRLIRPNEYR